MRLSQTRKMTSLSVPITLEHVLGPQNVWVLVAAYCSINVWGEAGNGARVQGTWEMLGIEVQPTGWPTLEEERVMGQSLPEDKPPSWCHKTNTHFGAAERKRLHITVGEPGWTPSHPAGSQSWESSPHV